MALQLRLASPCHEKWDAMSGDERKRFCAKCQLHVFNVKELTEPEVRDIFAKAGGERVCGVIYQRPDGTVLLKDCPTGVALLRRKALAAVTMAAALVLAVLGFGLVRAKQALTAPDDERWFDRTFGARLVDARETLRETRTLGPLIDELFPLAPTRMVMGKLALPPKAAP
jgi:hypothetical protein